VIDRVAQLCRRLEPVVPDQARQLWAAYQSDPDPGSRGQVEHMLEVLAQQHLGLGFQPDRSPFIPPPPEWAECGTLPVGEVVYAGKRHCDFNLEIDRLAEHVLVCGRSGSGKSTLTLHLARGLMQRGIVVTAFDWKRSYRDLLRDAPPGSLRVRTPGRDLAPFLWNPLIPPPGMDRVLYAKLIVDVISRALLGGDGVISLLHRGILTLYEREGVGREDQHRWPTIHDLLEWLESTRLTGRAAMWKSSADRILRAMTYGEFGKMIDTQSNSDLLALLDTHHVLELDGLAGSADRSIFAEGVTLWLYRYLLNRGERHHLERVWIHEEAHHLFSQGESSGGGSTEGVLEQSLRMARAYGVGFMIVDQTASMLSKTVFSNTGTVFALNQKLRSDVQAIAGAMNLDDEQRQAVSTLPVGTAIARVPDGHPEPFLIRIPAPSDGDHVSDDEVRQSMQAEPSNICPSPTVINAHEIEDEIVSLMKEMRELEHQSTHATVRESKREMIPISDPTVSTPTRVNQPPTPVLSPLPPPEIMNRQDQKHSESVPVDVDPIDSPVSNPFTQSVMIVDQPAVLNQPTGTQSASETSKPTRPPEDRDVTLDSDRDADVCADSKTIDTILSKPTHPPAPQEETPNEAVATTQLPKVPGAGAVRFLGDLIDCPLSTTVERYQRLHLSRRKGHALRTALVEADLIRPVRIPTRSGNVVLLELTHRGRRQCLTQGLEPSPASVAGLAHRYWAHRVGQKLKQEGYQVRHEAHVAGNGRVDLLATRDDEALPCEIETGHSDIAENLSKTFGHFEKVLMVATNAEAIEKCRKVIFRLTSSQQKRVELKSWLDY